MTTVPTFSGFDLNGDGKIDYENEFVKVMTPILQQYDKNKDGYISNGQGWREDGVDEIKPLVKDGWFNSRTKGRDSQNGTVLGMIDGYSISFKDYTRMLWEGIGGGVADRIDEVFYNDISIYRVLDIPNNFLKVTDEEKRKYITKCQ